MKIQYRLGVFETNSSSTHSLTMCSLVDYKKWKAGIVKYYIQARKFVDEEEAYAINNSVLMAYNEGRKHPISNFDELPIVDMMDGAVTAYQYDKIAKDQEWNTFVNFLEMGEQTAVGFGYFAIY